MSSFGIVLAIAIGIAVLLVQKIRLRIRKKTYLTRDRLSVRSQLLAELDRPIDDKLESGIRLWTEIAHLYGLPPETLRPGDRISDLDSMDLFSRSLDISARLAQLGVKSVPNDIDLLGVVKMMTRFP